MYFLNLSNHPSNEWESVQREAAFQLGGPIVDWPFPEIDPMASAMEVQQMCREEWKKIVEAHGKPRVALIQGEFTFTFCMVSLLLGERIRCVAATTRRHVKQLEEGKEIRKFRFVRFRDYPQP